MKIVTRKARLVSGVALLALTAAGSAFAQPAANVEEVVITGTRVRTPNLESPAPITTLSEQALAYTGKTNVQQMVAEVGSLVGSNGDDQRSTGESALNLRNLGQNRTLTLVNGRRFVSGFGGNSAVDINVIPAALIERVDVLTGGASAVYGADAVTGVVNFIMKKNFEGLAVDAQYGDAQKGDFRDQVYSVTAGRNLDGGRGNIAVNYTFGERPNVPVTARHQASDLYERVNNPNGSSPRYVLMNGTHDGFFANGGAFIDPGRTFSPGGFNGNGSPYIHGVNVGGYAGATEIGGDGPPTYTLFSDDLRPSNDRHIFSVLAHYDVSDKFRPYVEVHLSDVKNESLSQQSQIVFQPIASDTAFIPANVRAAAGATPIQFNRWDYDGGVRDQRIDKRTIRVVVGANGDLNDHLQYDVSANYGEVRRRSYIGNNRIYDRYLAALDSVVDPSSGKIVCRSDIDPSSFNRLKTDALAVAFNPALGPASFTAGRNSGCVPYNPFTTDSASQAQALAWIYQPTVDFVRNKQTVLSGYLTADTGAFFKLPGGPISLVGGGEYRKEESNVDFGPLSGSPRKIAHLNGVDVDGQYDVKEVFGEISAPLLKDMGPLIRELTVDGAYRYSDYSTVGKTNTWKVGGVFATALGLKFRGTYSKAARAPTIGELFTPLANGTAALGSNDPCSTSNVSIGTGTRKANCETALRALGVNPATFNPLLGTFFLTQTGGNINLKEETAKTLTYGGIWQPSFVPGLSVSVDYYDIKLSDAVITPTTNSIFNACYDAPDLNNQFCSLLKRDPTTGFASFVQISNVNVAKIYTQGYEFNGSYTLPTDYGRFTLSGNASYLKRLELQKTPAPQLTDDRGLYDTDTGGSSPKWVGNIDLTWSLGRWDANYGFNYSGRTLRNGITNIQRPTVDTFIDEPYIKAFYNHDVQVGYKVRQDSRLYAGIRNLTNEYPDKVQGSLNGLLGRQGYAGRTFYVGVNLKFADMWN
jgi:iron complex outermembrane receptor protein